MGILDKLGKNPGEPELSRLPKGTFTMDSQGRIVTSTVPQWVSEDQLKDIGQRVLAIFQNAATAQMESSEVVIQYAAFKITAREMGGGAIIFLAPKTIQTHARP